MTHSFDQFGLGGALLKAIGYVGYETPLPIQISTIPPNPTAFDRFGSATLAALKAYEDVKCEAERMEEGINS